MEHPWPHLCDAPFREAPRFADNVQLDARRMYGGIEGAYSIGYKDAADHLVARVIEEEQNRDVFLAPVAYLYRHYLELELKGMLREGRNHGLSAVAHVSANDIHTHNLLELWPPTRLMIEELWPNESCDDLNCMARIIQVFHDADPTGQGFRYARDREGNLHLEGMPRLVDLRHLQQVMDSAYAFLTSAMEGLHC